MRKISIFLCFLLLLPVFLGCEPNDDTQGKKEEDAFYFYGTVLSTEHPLAVDVTESDYAFGIYHVITDDATQYLDEKGRTLTREDIRVGDTVKVVYGGQVMLSYPPQVVAKKIQIEKD